MEQSGISISRRTLGIALAFAAVAAVAIPRGVEAASSQAVKIVDPVNGSQRARVTSKGSLKTSAEPRLHPKAFSLVAPIVSTIPTYAHASKPPKGIFVQSITLTNTGTTTVEVILRWLNPPGGDCDGPGGGVSNGPSFRLTPGEKFSPNLGQGFVGVSPCLAILTNSYPAGTDVGAIVTGYAL